MGIRIGTLAYLFSRDISCAGFKGRHKKKILWRCHYISVMPLPKDSLSGYRHKNYFLHLNHSTSTESCKGFIHMLHATHNFSTNDVPVPVLPTCHVVAVERVFCLADYFLQRIRVAVREEIPKPVFLYVADKLLFPWQPLLPELVLVGVPFSLGHVLSQDPFMVFLQIVEVSPLVLLSLDVWLGDVKLVQIFQQGIAIALCSLHGCEGDVDFGDAYHVVSISVVRNNRTLHLWISEVVTNINQLKYKNRQLRRFRLPLRRNTKCCFITASKNICQSKLDFQYITKTKEASLARNF